MTKTELSRLKEGDRVKVQIGPFNQLNGTVTMRDGALRIVYESGIVSSPLSELDSARLTKFRRII